MMKYLNTKLLKITGLFALTITCLISCKNYLDVAPEGSITQDQVNADPQAASGLVTGVYNQLYNTHSFEYIYATEILSDNADKGSNPTDAAGTAGVLDNLTGLTPGFTVINNVWSANFRLISKANIAIDAISASPASATTKQTLEAEAKFLRAYTYFNLVRWFGGVPIINKSTSLADQSSVEFQTRASLNDTYKFIISDLETALKLAPIKEQTALGKITKGAAAGLLAKVFLYKQNWARAYSLTDSIVTGKLGSYSLQSDYSTIWREVSDNNSESLFEIQTGVNSACNAALFFYVMFQGPRPGGKLGWTELGFGFNVPSQALVDEYEPGDKRKDATIITISTDKKGFRLYDGVRVPSQDSVENSRYNYKAYHSRTTEKYCGGIAQIPKNLKVIRYGDILLIRAESALALGNSTTALSDINQLRGRAGLNPLTTITRDAIWHERRIELAMEHDRFFDLMRQNTLSPGRALSEYAKHGKTFTNNKNELLPIPTVQIQLTNGKLIQNPGYN